MARVASNALGVGAIVPDPLPIKARVNPAIKFTFAVNFTPERKVEAIMSGDMVVDAQGIWSEVLPEVRNGVTGVGVWQALNATVAVATENDQFVIGLPPELGDLAGHLRLQQTKTLIERLVGQKLGTKITLRVIDGITLTDWETTKRRDVEALRLQEQAMARQRADIQSRSNWEVVYEQVSRKFASLQNKSLPQVRSKFFEECVDLMVESLKSIPKNDDNAERNYARCIERISTYSDLPSTFVALYVSQKTR